MDIIITETSIQCSRRQYQLINMKLNKYDFYSTVIGILLFICVAAFIALVMACGTTKQAQQPVDNWDSIKPWQYGALIDPQFALADEMYCNHTFVQIDGSDQCVCIDCKLRRACQGWNIPQGIIATTPMPLYLPTNDTLSTGCQHPNMMRTMMGCSPPSNQCNTCTCLDCGYSYKCN